MIGTFSFLIYWIVITGEELEGGRNITLPTNVNGYWGEFIESLGNNLHHPLAILLAQIATIIIIARLFGWFCKKIGQPTVIGEIAAGIILGPSLLGMYFPEFSSALFPVKSLGNLQFLSQIGLILFMFVIGMELNLKVLKNRAHEAVVISHASIIFPFTLGMGLAYFIYQSFAPSGVPFFSFALFLGIAMSITAFPVLARIIQERGMHKTRLGTMVITCAAADDITAWCMLAAVIAIVKAGSFISSLYVILLATIYFLLMIYVVKPFLKRIGDLYANRDSLKKSVVAIFFIMLILSAYATEIIGIHALFGAFMAGAIMPDNLKFRNIFIEKVEDVSMLLLLPLFFVFTGLRTEIGLLNDSYLWGIALLIILVAIIGKFAGSALAARFVGQNWKDSLIIGALMNTRGLMELVVLNIGYDLGILTPQIFAMMVIMALVTTVMTGPALYGINRVFKNKTKPVHVEQIKTVKKYIVLISFGNAESGKKLLLIANSLVKKMNEDVTITTMHLTPSNEIHHYNVEEYEQEIFTPIIEESNKLNQKIIPLFRASNDIFTGIAEVANEGDYDLLLVGLGESIFEGTLLGKVLGFTTRIVNPDRLIDKFTGKEKLFENTPFDETTRQIIIKSKISVGVLLDKNLEKTEHIFLPIFNIDDAFLIAYATKFITSSNSKITILDVSEVLKNNIDISDSLRSIEKKASGNISILSNRKIEKDFLDKQDMMIISIDSWKKLIDSQSIWLNNTPSVLIIKP